MARFSVFICSDCKDRSARSGSTPIWSVTVPLASELRNSGSSVLPALPTSAGFKHEIEMFTRPVRLSVYTIILLLLMTPSRTTPLRNTWQHHQACSHRRRCASPVWTDDSVACATARAAPCCGAAAVCEFLCLGPHARYSRHLFDSLSGIAFVLKQK